MKKISSILLVIVLCCSYLLAGCQNNNPSTDPEEPNSPAIMVPTIPVDRFIVPDSENDFLVNNGECDYIIVHPEESTDYEETAVEEFITLFYEGAGILLTAQTDDQSIPDQTPFISVGKTKQLEDAGIEIDGDELGISGYKIKTIGKNVYIAGDTGMGTLFGVYDFLHYSIGYEFYAADCITFDKKSSYPLKLFDITLRPDIDVGEFGWRAFRDYGEFTPVSNRYKSFSPMYVENFQGHTTFFYFPKSEYYDQHRDWYSTDGQQLCFSNNEMFEEMVRKIEQHLLENTAEKNHMIFIGQEDVFTWCRCNKCSASKSRYGTDSAVLIKFMNKLSARIGEWLEENQPWRNVCFGFYAYHMTEAAPVEAAPDGTLRPYDNDKSLILADNVYPMIAPLAKGFNKPIEEDEGFVYLLKSWSVLAKKICFWSYCFYPYQMYINFDNFNSLQKNLQLLKSYNTFYVIDQGGMYDPASPTFLAYRAYITYKLIWDVNVSVQTLKENFFSNYYDDASGWLIKYLDELLLLQRYNAEKYDIYGTVGEQMTMARYWPQAVLTKWLSYFDNAYKAIEHYKTTDINYYNTLYNRIRLEQLSVLYLSIELYGEQMFDIDTLLAHKKAVYYDLTRYGCFPYDANPAALQQLGISWGVA